MNRLRALAARLAGGLTVLAIPACCEITSPAPPPPGPVGPGDLVGNWSGTATYNFFPTPQTFSMDIQFDGTNLVVEMNGAAYGSYVTRAEDPDFRFKTAFPPTDSTAFMGVRQDQIIDRIDGTLSAQSGTSGTWTVQRVGPRPAARVPAHDQSELTLAGRGTTRVAIR